MPPLNNLKGWHKLPFELRLEIHEFILALPEPPTPSTAQEGRIVRYDYAWGGQGLWEVPLTSPTGNLLLVSKQFYNDVKHIIDLLPNIYNVDVMVVKDYGLWPTWHCLNHLRLMSSKSHGPGLIPEKPPCRYTGPPKYVVKRTTMNILSPTDGVAHTKL
ncbi:unnamed protein product [Fusarium equiseti]|uniref:Uncharacterized protein n=1 Tax=Fusarium equiseti TaxID=61235 RepID=A0A8J2NH20_FUSEQ|nr:unnamed protein product [Fusarium equiseti]